MYRAMVVHRSSHWEILLDEIRLISKHAVIKGISLSRKEMKRSEKCIMFDFQRLACETLLGPAGKL